MRVFVPLLLALSLALTACGGTGGGASPKKEPLQVFAAASLKAAFEEIARHHDGEVVFNFDGSQNLVSAIDNGARADVLATADEKNMTRATDKKLVDAPTIFASNVLVLVTPAGNPAGVTGLDASLNGRKLVTCAVGVPCGNATEKLSTQLGVTLQPVSQEQRVTDVLGKVTAGEADAGIVYATDAKGAGDKVDTIEIPGSDKAVNRYPIAPVASTKRGEDAKAFIALVTSAEGQQILKQHGFRAP